MLKRGSALGNISRVKAPRSPDTCSAWHSDVFDRPAKSARFTMVSLDRGPHAGILLIAPVLGCAAWFLDHRGVRASSTEFLHFSGGGRDGVPSMYLPLLAFAVAFAMLCPEDLDSGPARGGFDLPLLHLGQSGAPLAGSRPSQCVRRATIRTTGADRGTARSDRLLERAKG